MLVFFYTLYRFGRGVIYAFEDPEFQVLFTLTAIVLATGTLFYHGNEGWSIFDSLYFSVVTLTTVGYGDMHPTNDASRAFTMLYLFVGLGILFSFVNAITHHAIEDGKKNGILLPKRFRFRRTKKHGSAKEIADPEA